MRNPARLLVDWLLPPRCPGCGTMTDTPDSFCATCFQAIDWLGDSGCRTCGTRLEGVPIDGDCAACHAQPPRIARARAVVAYADPVRSPVLRLKHNRRIALARMMGRLAAPLVAPEAPADALLVPVPLHRRRLAARGFNQSLLIARAIARHRPLAIAPRALTRTKATPMLRGLTRRQRADTVRAAFAADPAQVAARHIILIDDVITTGATADACAKALLKAGATRVDLVSFARVVRPATLAR